MCLFLVEECRPLNCHANVSQDSEAPTEQSAMNLQIKNLSQDSQHQTCSNRQKGLHIFGSSYASLPVPRHSSTKKTPRLRFFPTGCAPHTGTARHTSRIPAPSGGDKPLFPSPRAISRCTRKRIKVVLSSAPVRGGRFAATGHRGGGNALESKGLKRRED